MAKSTAVFAFLLLTAYITAAQSFRVCIGSSAQLGRDYSLLVYDTDSLPRVFKPNDKKGPIVFTGKVDGAVYAELRHPKVAQPLPFFVENAEISISYNADNPETSHITGSRANSELRYQLEICDRNNGCLTEYVQNNSASPFAPYTIDRFLFSSTDYETVSSLFRILNGPATKTYHYRQLEQRLKRLEALTDGKRIPDFTFTDLKNHTCHLDSVLVDSCYNIIIVGATYCHQCKEIENKLYKSFPQIHPIALDIDRLKEGWDASFLKQLEIDHIPYLILLDHNHHIIARDLRIWQLNHILKTNP